MLCRSTPTPMTADPGTPYSIFPISGQCGTRQATALHHRSCTGEAYTTTTVVPPSSIMAFSSANRSPAPLPEKVWPPRESDHDTGRLIKNMAFFTIFGWGVKATQMAILMETKLARYTPEMKAITKKKWIGESSSARAKQSPA